MSTQNTTHAQWWLDRFAAGDIGPQDLYSGADIVKYGTEASNGTDVLLYVDGSKLTVPMDGEAVAS